MKEITTEEVARKKNIKMTNMIIKEENHITTESMREDKIEPDTGKT